VSVRNALLAILTLGPAYGLQLASEFQRRTGGAEDVIDGQMYTTLGRLERDGVVTALPKDPSGRVRYELTHRGRAEAIAWLAAPVPSNESGARDALALKVTLSATLPGANLGALMTAQGVLARAELDRARAATPDDVLADVVLARRRSSLQAELDWLREAGAELEHFEPFGYAPPPKRGRKAKPADTPGE
jgi:DNA-binding PadR family transcriptional regulator